MLSPGFSIPMKSPEELAKRLARQWSDARLRETRLLNGDAWPVRISIAKPTANEVINEPALVQDRISAWRRVSVGRITWKSIRYRSLADELPVPISWELDTPSQWIEAASDSSVGREFEKLSRIIESVDPLFHSYIIRQRHTVTHTLADEIITAARVAMTVWPGMADGAPLRSLPIAGVDSKFFERNKTLVTRLLDIRFEGAASDKGLEAFLGAVPDSNQWLLLVDLDGNLLPFSQIRIRASELEGAGLPGKRLLIVENERCSYALPQVEDCISLLGAGLNLTWLGAKWLANTQIAYWGDIDTWGLTMLARAREKQPGLTALLMSREVFDRFKDVHAVPEPVPAPQELPSHLSVAEADLYQSLLRTERGRLEQEFLPTALVQSAILGWAQQPAILE